MSALESIHVDFVQPDGTTALSVDVPKATARGQLLTDDLCRLIAGGLAEWEACQRDLAEDLRGMGAWRYDGNEASLRFELEGGELVMPAQVLGSYSRTQYSWCWSWANATYKPIDWNAVAQLRDHLSQSVGAGALWRPGFFSDERFALLVAQLAAEQLDALGIFARDVTEDLLVCYAVFDPG